MKFVRIVFNWLVVGVGIYWFAGKFEPNWELGRYYMPRMIVSADGTHFLNGEEIDAFSLAVVRTGMEEEMLLGILATVVAGMCWISWQRRKR
jgi:hypothetical protein